MPDADQVYVDPSALTCLYLHQHDRSRRIIAWRARIGGTLPVTHHGRVEITNALCRARFEGHLDDAGLQEALADLDADFTQGRSDHVSILWRAALNLAADLSRRHTPRLGVRTGDVLHVACALELKRPHFLTFDDRQRALAKAVGLKPINL